MSLTGHDRILQKYWRDDIAAALGTGAYPSVPGAGGPFAPSPHEFGGPHHTGFFYHDWLAGIDPDQHHNKAHELLGADHTVSDLTEGHYLRAVAPDSIAFQPIQDADLPATIVRTSRQITAGAGLSGGGDLSQDRSLAVDQGYNFNWTGQHQFANNVLTQTIQPLLTDSFDLGTSTKLWRKVYASELDAVLFAKQTISLLGGWLVIPKDAGTLAADVASADTTIDFGKTMTTGHFVVMRAALKVEYVQVGTLVSGTRYNVTRDLDGTGANDWPAGTPFAVLGTTGDGRIELNAYDTPRISLLSQGAAYNAQTELLRIGDLNGNWGYGSQTWGVAIGEYASGKASLTVDSTNGIRIFQGTTLRAQWKPDGTINIGEVGQAGKSYLQLTSTNVRFINNATERLSIDANGTIRIGTEANSENRIHMSAGGIGFWNRSAAGIDKQKLDLSTSGTIKVGSDVSSPATTHLAIFTGDQTYNGEAVGDGDLLIGDNSSGKANILWDKSTGKLLFRGGTTAQVEIGTDGALSAGGGNVLLNADGVRIISPVLTDYSMLASTNKLSFYNTTEVANVAELGAYVYNAAAPYLNRFQIRSWQRTVGSSNYYPQLTIDCATPTNTRTAYIDLVGATDAYPGYLNVGPTLGVEKALAVGMYGDLPQGTITLLAGLQTAARDHLKIAAEWSNASATFRAIYANITNTASAATSRLLDLAVGGTSKFSVDLSGNVAASGRIFGAAWPRCIVYRSTAQTIPTGTWTLLEFDAEGADNDNMHDATTNPSRITINTPGIYIVTASVRFASNATGYRLVELRQGGNEVARAGIAAINGTDTPLSVTAIRPAAANDYFEVWVYQTSGAGLNVNVSGTRLPHFAAAMIST